MDDKQHILTTLREEYHRWEELLNSLHDDQINASQTSLEMSVKDVMAHLWSWQQLSIARLEAAIQNQEPVFHLWPSEFDSDAEDVDQLNAWTYRTYHDKPWTEIHDAWKDGFLHFLELIEAIPESDLFDAEKYPWLNGDALIVVVTGSYEHHHIDHLEPVLALFGADTHRNDVA